MRDESHSGDRRQFLKKIGVAAAGGLLAGPLSSAMAQTAPPAAQPGMPSLVPKRKFGKHDFEVSAMALGGYTLAEAEEKESFRIVDEAIASGVTFMDNCWDYHQGRAEEVMGRALKGKRDQVFLMTKVCNHGQGGKKESMQMLEESLRRLQTDHLDLWQLHTLGSLEQVEHAFSPGGPVEALEEAKKQGKVRFIGFTGHRNPDVHVAMLKREYPFDSCQFPLSAIDANADAFQRKVLPEVLRQKIAPLAMKTLGGNAQAIRDGVLTVDEALRYAFSLPVATVVSGINSIDQLRQNVKAAQGFTPMPREEMIALEARCKPAAESEKYEPYRKWLSYRDGDASKYSTFS